jgi:hypothetical protein
MLLIDKQDKRRDFTLRADLTTKPLPFVSRSGAG